jgi:hypothetical protein
MNDTTILTIRLHRMILWIPPSRKFTAISAEYAGVQATSETLLPCKNEYSEFDLFNELLSIKVPANNPKLPLFISVWLFDQKGSEYELAKFTIPHSELLVIGRSKIMSGQAIYHALSRIVSGGTRARIFGFC